MSSEARLVSLFTLLNEDVGWMRHGTCFIEGAPTDIFILEQGQTSSRAREYCARCPMRKECLKYGKESGSVGVWGGEVLGMNNREEVKLTPVIFFGSKLQQGNIDDLVDPPPVAGYQSPLELF